MRGSRGGGPGPSPRAGARGGAPQPRLLLPWRTTARARPAVAPATPSLMATHGSAERAGALFATGRRSRPPLPRRGPFLRDAMARTWHRGIMAPVRNRSSLALRTCARTRGGGGSGSAERRAGVRAPDGAGKSAARASGMASGQLVGSRRGDGNAWGHVRQVGAGTTTHLQPHLALARLSPCIRGAVAADCAAGDGVLPPGVDAQLML